MRVDGGRRQVSDGPFIETKEQLGGFVFLEVRDLDEAMQWAERMPWNTDGCSTEIRPIMDYEAYGARVATRLRGARRVLSEPAAASAVDRLFREHFGRAVAALIRAVGDWDLAEEAVQDAFATALERWPRDGVPHDPAAWIVAVARNRAIDRLRRERALRARVSQLAARRADRRRADRKSRWPRACPTSDCG